MQLYNFCHSSTSYRVRIALALKGVEYEYLPVNLRAGQQRSAEYLQINPSGGVPVLVTDDGVLLSQSLAILEYLEVLYPQYKLLPVESLARARVMEVANMISCDIHPLNNVRVKGYLSRQLQLESAQVEEWGKHWVGIGLAAVEDFLQRYGSGNYCFGNEPSLADCCLVPQVTNALRMGINLDALERVTAIYQRCIQHPAFIQAAPINQIDFVP